MCIYPVFFCVLFRFRLSLYGTIVTEFFYCDNLMPSTCKVALLLLGIFEPLGIDIKCTHSL